MAIFGTSSFNIYHMSLHVVTLMRFFSVQEVQVHGIRAADVTLAELEQLAQRSVNNFGFRVSV